MSIEGDRHERTMAFAAVALERIKALRHPAEPKYYEIWYSYATNYNPPLNKAINDALARRGTLTPADVDAIHGTYFSPTRTSERIGSVGAKVADEIDQVMAMMESAVGSTSTYSESLADASQQLGRTHDREALRVIVEGLVQTTREFELHNQALESRLKATLQEIQGLQADLEAARHENQVDPLTTLSSRKYFDQALAKAMAATAANGEPMSLLLTDIDHFKTFNDTYGHLTGDQVLRLVALCIKQSVKGQDIAARYGGEEFAIVLPNTALRDAIKVAENIRRSVMAKELMKRSTGESLGRITISAGVATWHRDDTLQSLIERADACLYAAKRAGRNRAMCETDPETRPLAAARVA